MKYAAFLRAVNVSGHNRLKMDALKKALADNGYAEPATYLQSGNIVFESGKARNESLAAAIERLLRDNFKLDVTIFVKSKGDMASIISNNPFLDPAHDESFLHVTFYGGSPGDIDRNAVEKLRTGGEEYAIKQDHIYIYCPNGYGRTKLNNTTWEKWGTCTTRNWNTIKAVHSLMVT